MHSPIGLDLSDSDFSSGWKISILDVITNICATIRWKSPRTPRLIVLIFASRLDRIIFLSIIPFHGQGIPHPPHSDVIEPHRHKGLFLYREKGTYVELVTESAPIPS